MTHQLARRLNYLTLIYGFCEEPPGKNEGLLGDRYQISAFSVFLWVLWYFWMFCKFLCLYLPVYCYNWLRMSTIDDDLIIGVLYKHEGSIRAWKMLCADYKSGDFAIVWVNWICMHVGYMVKCGFCATGWLDHIYGGFKVFKHVQENLEFSRKSMHLGDRQWPIAYFC